MTWAIVSNHGSSYLPARQRNPDEWFATEVGRETPQRVYVHPEKQRWSDPFWRKSDQVVAICATQEEAHALIQKAKLHVAGLNAIIADAWADSRRAQERASRATSARNEALLGFWERHDHGR